MSAEAESETQKSCRRQLGFGCRFFHQGGSSVMLSLTVSRESRHAWGQQCTVRLPAASSYSAATEMWESALRHWCFWYHYAFDPFTAPSTVDTLLLQSFKADCLRGLSLNILQVDVWLQFKQKISPALMMQHCAYTLWVYWQLDGIFMIITVEMCTLVQ